MSFNFVIPELQLNGAGTPPLQFFKRSFNLGTSGSSPIPWIDIVLSGVGSLTLTNAKKNSISYLKLFGGCSQTGTPAPDNVCPITCNNGALTMVDDELPSGYKRLLGFTCDNNVLWRITDFKLRGSDTVRISFSVTAGCNVFGCYQSTTSTDNYDLYVSTSSGAKYLRYGASTYLSYWSSNDLNKRFDIVYTPNGSQGMPQDSTWSPETFESANDLIIGSTSLTGTSAKLKGNLYGNFEVDNRLKIIPCERLSDNSLGYYDTYSETFFEPTGTPTSLGYDGSHYVLVIDGTTETVQVKDSNNTILSTATATDLLAVGTYKDVQEVLTGNVTRNVGIKVLNGTETYTRRNDYAVNLTSITDRAYGVNINGQSTHFNCKSGNQQTEDVGTLLFNTSNNFIHLFTSLGGDVDEVKQWLKDQYNAGTPVIIIYPLATATTESVTGQHLSIKSGTNTITITQAAIDNLPLEVKYKGTVEEEIEEEVEGE